MSVQLRKPKARVCEQCDRTERWDEERECWQLNGANGVGNPHCIHEWDINGTFYPFE